MKTINNNFIFEGSLNDALSGKMKIKLDDDTKAPTRAHTTDAGLDIFSKQDKIVYAHSSAIFHTGVHVQLPPNTVGMLKSKSGLNVNYGITSEGVIDEGYTGEIVVKLYNNSNEDYWVTKGDKITQLVVLPVLYKEIEIVEEFEETDRGDNGFGSSGK